MEDKTEYKAKETPVERTKTGRRKAKAMTLLILQSFTEPEAGQTMFEPIASLPITATEKEIQAALKANGEGVYLIIKGRTSTITYGTKVVEEFIVAE